MPSCTGPLQSAKAIATDIKLAHSVFALPFAVLGAFMAGPTPTAHRDLWFQFIGKLLLVIACMVLARTWAMILNRLADRSIDARHERTKGRAFASGRVRPGVGWVVAIACAAGFVAVTWVFDYSYGNPWPLRLSLPVLAWLALYSWSKRFTWLCHLVLGVALAMSPIAAALAVRPQSVLETPALWWLAGFVMLWVAGFDIVYALQDEEFDRAEGLNSIPAKVGTVGAVWAARGAHALALLSLLAAWTSHSDLRGLFGIAAGVVALTLAVEHAVLARSTRAGQRPRLHMAFFTANGIMGLLLGTAGVADMLLAPTPLIIVTFNIF